MRPPNVAALPHIQKSSLAHQGRRMMNTTMTLLPRHKSGCGRTDFVGHCKACVAQSKRRRVQSIASRGLHTEFCQSEGIKYAVANCMETVHVTIPGAIWILIYIVTLTPRARDGRRVLLNLVTCG